MGTPHCDGPDGGFALCDDRTGITVTPVTWPITQERPMNGAALTDCDDDGLPDAYVFNWASSGRMYRNRGGMRFADITAASGLGMPERTINAAFGDLDGDGHADLVVTQGFEAILASMGIPPTEIVGAVRIFRGQGACRFTETTTAWGFGAVRTGGVVFPSGVDLVDVNNDGRLDVMLRMLPEQAARPVLYLSRPDDRWEDRTCETLGCRTGSTWATLFTDTDDDGLIDLFLMTTGGDGGPPGQFLHRAGPSWPPRFVDAIPAESLFSELDQGRRKLMGGATADFDGDGRLDVFLSDIGAQHVLRSLGGGLYEDVAFRVGAAASMLPNGGRTVAFGASALDFDNDGYPDLTFATSTDQGDKAPPYAFLLHNRGDGTFSDESPRLGPVESHNERALAASDLDRDGRVDLWFGGAGEPPRILRNQSDGGASVAVQLRGRTSNREGIGAQVRVVTGARTLVQEMNGGGNAYGYNEQRLVFGLGDGSVERIEVRWPSGYVQRVTPPRQAREVRIEEPPLVRVEPAIVRPGEAALVTVRPMTADGRVVGSGRLVEVALEPSGEPIVVTDLGDGSYTARVTGEAPGVRAVRVTIDGHALLARPLVLVRN